VPGILLARKRLVQKECEGNGQKKDRGKKEKAHFETGHRNSLHAF
jgi:hypothetical protein